MRSIGYGHAPSADQPLCAIKPSLRRFSQPIDTTHSHLQVPTTGDLGADHRICEMSLAAAMRPNDNQAGDSCQDQRVGASTPSAGVVLSARDSDGVGTLDGGTCGSRVLTPIDPSRSWFDPFVPGSCGMGFGSSVGWLVGQGRTPTSGTAAQESPRSISRWISCSEMGFLK